ncbi:MAG TPA: hypothetical protein VGH38_08070 [Bryobacteraceae bacterium]
MLKDLDPAGLIGAIRELHAGGAPMSPDVARRVVLMFQKFVPPRTKEDRLSEPEMDVLRLLERRATVTRPRRTKLSLSVRFHVRNIHEQLHVYSESEAVSLKSGWIR